MVIFTQTFKMMLKLKRTLIYLIFIALGSLLAVFAMREAIDGTSTNVNLLIDRYLSIFFMFTFMWVIGIPFLISMANRGASLIQEEIEEGTLVVLVSKPISRYRILLEKWLASFVVSLLLGLTSMFINLTMMVFMLSLDSAIISILLSLQLSLIVYIIFMNIVMTSISLMFSLVLKKRVRTIILLVVLIMVTFAVFPLFKVPLMQMGYYDGLKLYLIDLNYQFGVVYYTIIDTFTTIKFTPETQVIISQFLGIFEVGNASPFTNGYGGIDEDLGFLHGNFGISKYIHPAIIISFWVTVSAANILLSTLLVKRMDIS
ncbi:ABC transporter permease subunit [Haloplasma contractile]|uniref:ABC-2 type transport permease protein n=1 Tax=Haloplasma contractile SSD-17B TaxID=1033810 RepID=U2FPH7_9MOLU|nr:ABC transporter permease subunit [Haloplasma contractile]ERJ12979.1 putative ABC-2 type transport permease protein [Haloplasma contractile SSD-17B]